MVSLGTSSVILKIRIQMPNSEKTLLIILPVLLSLSTPDLILIEIKRTSLRKRVSAFKYWDDLQQLLQDYILDHVCETYVNEWSESFRSGLSLPGTEWITLYKVLMLVRGGELDICRVLILIITMIYIDKLVQPENASSQTYIKTCLLMINFSDDKQNSSIFISSDANRACYVETVILSKVLLT